MRGWPLLALALTGCGHSCPGLEAPAFDVTVTSANGTDVCNATVVASSVSGTFTLLELTGSSDASCSYGGLNGILPTGAYTLSVTATGFAQTTVPNVIVKRDDCNLEQTTTLTVVLAAQ